MNLANAHRRLDALAAAALETLPNHDPEDAERLAVSAAVSLMATEYRQLCPQDQMQAAIVKSTIRRQL